LVVKILMQIYLIGMFQKQKPGIFLLKILY
jgi:hypothetical protein